MEDYKLIEDAVDFYCSPHALIKYPDSLFLGEHVAIDQFVTIGATAYLGDYVHIAPNVSVIGGQKSVLRMGAFSGLSAGVRVIAGGDNFNTGKLTNPQVPIELRDVFLSEVIIEDFCIVGTNAVIFPGVKLAEGSMVGAGSVVNKDTEPWTIYVGSPARPVSKRNKLSVYENANKLGYSY